MLLNYKKVHTFARKCLIRRSLSSQFDAYGRPFLVCNDFATNDANCKAIIAIERDCFCFDQMS